MCPADVDLINLDDGASQYLIAIFWWVTIFEPILESSAFSKIFDVKVSLVKRIGWREWWVVKKGQK